MEKEDLYGTWRLMSFMQQSNGGEKTEFLGKSPHGFLSYGRDGRMSAMIVKDERPPVADPANPTDAELAGLFNTMFAYGGTFTFDGKQVTHHVDISWNGSWTGTDQVRDVRLEGGKLHITSVQPDLIAYYLVWEKV